MENSKCTIQEFHATQLSRLIQFLSEEFEQQIPIDTLSSDITETCLEGKLTPKYLVALCDGEIIGAIGYREMMVNFGYAELCYLCVAKNFRGQGIGMQLIERALLVSTEKIKARYHLVSTIIPSLFEKVGFKIIFTDEFGTPLMLKG